MKLVLIYIVNILIVGLFLYPKLTPYKDRLNPKYKSIFDFFNKVYTPILSFLKRFFKPFEVGRGLAIDMSQIVLLILLLIILNVSL